MIQSHSLQAYANAHRSVIKLRDQKQLDFEELSAYLSAVVSDRDRLAALSSGHAGTPVGLGTYLRDQVDRIRGTDDLGTRRERMRKLDTRIKEVCRPLFGVACLTGLVARSSNDSSRDVYGIFRRGAQRAHGL
jgi:sorting nexin-4